MTVNSEEFVHDYANRMAPLSQRQMPVFSQVGKGLRGDSFAVELNEDGASTSLEGKQYNQMTESIETIWSLPVMNLVPQIHYQVWKGVREIDGILMWGYYIHYTCSMEMFDDPVTFWSFDTPFVYTNPFFGINVPADEIIDSDQ